MRCFASAVFFPDTDIHPMCPKAKQDRKRRKLLWTVDGQQKGVYGEGWALSTMALLWKFRGGFYFQSK